MKKLGAEELALSVIEKFKSTFLINKETSLISEEITEILICSDAVLFEYLEPLLYDYSHQNIKITFMDLDCACLGASFLSSLYSKSSINAVVFEKKIDITYSLKKLKLPLVLPAPGCICSHQSHEV